MVATIGVVQAMAGLYSSCSETRLFFTQIHYCLMLVLKTDGCSRTT